jgi:hypothetical protein
MRCISTIAMQQLVVAVVLAMCFSSMIAAESERLSDFRYEPFQVVSLSFLEELHAMQPSDPCACPSTPARPGPGPPSEVTTNLLELRSAADVRLAAGCSPCDSQAKAHNAADAKAAKDAQATAAQSTKNCAPGTGCPITGGSCCGEKGTFCCDQNAECVQDTKNKSTQWVCSTAKLQKNLDEIRDAIKTHAEVRQQWKKASTNALNPPKKISASPTQPTTTPVATPATAPAPAAAAPSTK